LVTDPIDAITRSGVVTAGKVRVKRANSSISAR
jgi:hypothetical protein